MRLCRSVILFVGAKQIEVVTVSMQLQKYDAGNLIEDAMHTETAKYVILMRTNYHA